MKKLLIIIVVFLLNLAMSNTTYERTSTLDIEGTGYTFTYKKNTVFLYNVSENKDYAIEILKDKVILDMAVSDLDSDGTDELLILSANKGDVYGEDIIFFSLSLHKGNMVVDEIYRNDFSPIKPWNLQVCDIDGDSAKDIFVGVYKSTPMFKDVENRPFFFNWDGKILSKKWAGSKLEYSFESVVFYDLIGDKADEFIVVEQLADNKELVSIYYWFGFGFVKFAESDHYANIDQVRVVVFNNTPHLELTMNNEKNTVLLHLKGNQLIENIRTE